MPDVRDLPRLPRRGYGDGYDWMDELSGGWFAISSWGANGWDLGSWPLVIVCTCKTRTLLEDRPVFGVATYVEGDIDVAAYPTHQERTRAIDDIAAFYWRLAPERPPYVPRIGPLPAGLTGPFSWERAEREAGL